MTKKKEVFDAAAAKAVVSELRGSFLAGKTRSYEWRVAQLKSMFKMLDEHEPEIVAALRDDISKPELESSLYEVITRALLHQFNYVLLNRERMNTNTNSIY